MYIVGLTPMTPKRVVLSRMKTSDPYVCNDSGKVKTIEIKLADPLIFSDALG